MLDTPRIMTAASLSQHRQHSSDDAERAKEVRLELGTDFGLARFLGRANQRIC
jgi:hypothetical protein